VNITNVSLVPLQHASLCLDCETITTAHTNCMACGSRALLNLARILSQHTAGLSSANPSSAAPIAFPVRQRHGFHTTERNVDRRLELSAAPMQFAIAARNRHETFES